MKPLSRLNRINTSPILYGKDFDLAKPHDRLVMKNVEVRGRIMKKKEVEAYDTKTLLNVYCASDFALENLIAAGVSGSLSPCSATLDTLSAADHMDDVMLSMSHIPNNE